MNLRRLPHLLFLAIAAMVSACSTTPTSVVSPPAASTARATIADAEQVRPWRLYTRPPNRLFGLMLEQGSLDAVPDVAPMVEYQQQRMLERTANTAFRKAAPAWEELGPNTNLGRVIEISFHPQNSNIVYVASPGGGVYKSIDGGVSWTKLSGLPYQPVNSIAINPLNPNVIYFATGHFSGGGSDLLAMGVYKSTDAGATFSLLPVTVPTTTSTDWLRVTRVIAHPTVPNLVFAGTTTGFFVSEDAGVTWAKVSGASTYDISIDPFDPTHILRGKFDGSVSYSTDTGRTWAQVEIVPPDTTTNTRTRVKFAKSTPRVVYASVDQNDGEIHKSTDGGLTWAMVSAPAHLSTQGFHTNQLWVSPVDPNHLISGGVDLYKSTNGGATFTKISNWQLNSQQTGAGVAPDTPHADHNAVASPPDYSEANPAFFVGTDGGLFSTTNARSVTTSAWTKNGGGLSITQFVGAAGKRSATGVDTLVGGTQDNGTLLNIGYAGWNRIAGGDGGFAVTDPTEDYVFGEFQNGVVFRYGPAGLRAICTGILDADPDSCGAASTLKLNFYSPLEIDSASRLYLGGNALWRTVNPKGAATWTSVKPAVAGTTSGTKSSNYINAMSIQQGSTTLAIVGHNDGQIFRTTNLSATTPTWASLGTTGLPTGRAVGALYIDADDANRIYVGFTGYNNNNLWRTDNGGTSWQNISTGLPPGSIYAITRHPQAKDRVFVGTIWGMYGSINAGLTWPSINDGPATTRISRLFWLGNSTLVAGTFGNGMYRANVPLSIVTPPNTVVEFYHPILDNYFITADPVEQAAVDAGAAGAEWARTGNTFKAGGPNLVCRFYGNARANPATGTIYGPNSHFYTVDTAECAGLKAAQNPVAKSWFFESNDFATSPSVNQTCAAGRVPVYRAYNDGFARGVDSNHRITSSLASINQVVSRGWKNEGVVMCAPGS